MIPGDGLGYQALTHQGGFAGLTWADQRRHSEQLAVSSQFRLYTPFDIHLRYGDTKIDMDINFSNHINNIQ